MLVQKWFHANFALSTQVQTWHLYKLLRTCSSVKAPTIQAQVHLARFGACSVPFSLHHGR